MQPNLRRGVALTILLGVPAAGQDRLFKHDGWEKDLHYGFTVRRLGDLDADGVRDYAVGAIMDAAKVYSGRTGGTLYSYTGTGCFGMGIADLGDVDGDGVSDFAIAAIRENSALAPGAGRVRFYSGASGQLFKIIEGDTTDARFGLAMASVGDFDLDGVPDVLISSLWDSTLGEKVGSADVFSCATGAVLRHCDGDKPKDWFGASVAATGDLDADGYPDYAVGAPYAWYDATGSEPPGFVRAFSGSSGQALYTIHGTSNEDHYGTSVAALGDLNGDGVGELAIGAPRHRVAGAMIGRVEIRSGASGSFVRAFTGQPNSKFGTATRSAGDFDGDGYDDVIVGACYCDNTGPTDPGKGYSELRSGADGSLLVLLDDGTPLQNFAYSVEGLGDINEDGKVDFAVGQTWDAPHFPLSGSAWVYSGKDLTLSMDVHELSVLAGGAQALALQAPASLGGALYFVLGSASGTKPGIPLHPVTLPLVFDEYLLYTLHHPNSPIYSSTLGVLDAGGHATAAIQLPAGLLPPSFAGVVLHHAYVAVTAQGFELASNPLPLGLLP